MAETAIVIRIVEQVGGVIAPAPEAPHGWVMSFDPEAREGRGSLELTEDLDEAMKFADMGEAIAYYRRQSQTTPYREDGKPNRPMTAFTVTFQPVTGVAVN